MRLRHLWRDASLIVLFNGLLAVWLLARPGSHAVVTAVDNVAQFAGPLVVALWVFASVWWHERHDASDAGDRSIARKALRYAPVMLGLAVLGIGIGQMIFTIYEQVLHIYAPFPSLADATWLPTYPCLLLAILLLPTRQSSLVTRTRVVLDGLMTMTAIVTFSWYFILGPTILQGNGSIFAKVVGAAYPCGDLVLMVSLVLLAARSTDLALRRVVQLLSLALGVIVITDSIFDYETLHSAYATGSLLDVGWPLGFMLVGLGALALRPALMSQAASDMPIAGQRSQAWWHTTPKEWRSLLPYALIPLVGGLVLYSLNTHGDGRLEPGIFVGSAALVVLVLIRQVLDIRENAELNRNLEEANRRLEALATTDPRTDLPNHRALMSVLEYELERAYRYHRPCSVIFLDLDHFKDLNDGLGHPAGDTVLQELGAVARRTLRAIDILARWGGEEFVAILPETDGEGALAAAERVRAAVARQRFPVGGGLHVTCSLGVATYPHDAHDRDELAQMADQAMYAAKRLGRNQVRGINDAAVGALSTEMGSVGSREEAALLGTVEALAALVDVRDAYTGRHSHEVSILSVRIALALGLDTSQTHMLALAARLHDVGKVGIPDVVLLKPGRLTEDEWVLIRAHPAVGADVVSRVPALRMLAPVIRGHHERWDGRGYPDGLCAEAIPFGARIIAVADAFNAMLTDRPYRQASDASFALQEIRRCAETQFDSAVVEALERVLVEKPSVVDQSMAS